MKKNFARLFASEEKVTLELNEEETRVRFNHVEREYYGYHQFYCFCFYLHRLY